MFKSITKNAAIFGLIVLAYTSAFSSVQADELVYYVYPSPKGFNWTSPSRLVWSAKWNQMARVPGIRNKHMIGHVSTELMCDATESESAIYRHVGTTAADKNYFGNKIVNKKEGMGVLLSDAPGRFDNVSDLAVDMQPRFDSGRITYLRFKISSETCRRVAQYLIEYEQQGYHTSYGLPARPRYREGGGCSAFGVSLLEIAGLMQPEWYSEWSRTIRIPTQLVGGPLTGRRVSLNDVMSGPYSSRWATENEPHYSVFLYDPDLMFYSIVKRAKQAAVATDAVFTYEKRSRSAGLFLDASALPTPTEPFWLTEAIGPAPAPIHQ